jgi:hypothetical protein
MFKGFSSYTLLYNKPKRVSHKFKMITRAIFLYVRLEYKAWSRSKISFLLRLRVQYAYFVILLLKGIVSRDGVSTEAFGV